MKDDHIQYIELYTTDLDSVKRFYREAFGWSFTDYGEEYSAFSDAGIDGGFAKVKAVTHGGPLVILYHSRLRDALKRIEQSGGTITKDIFNFPGGQRFHFTDPAGNELAVWSDK